MTKEYVFCGFHEAPLFTITDENETPIPLCRGTEESAGTDIPSPIDVTIPPGETVHIPTGLRSCFGTPFQPGMRALLDVRSRSSLAKRSVFVANSPGTIDKDYEGIIGVLLHNLSNEPVMISRGEYIAQLVYLETPLTTCLELLVKRPKRGEGGFGSTGK